MALSLLSIFLLWSLVSTSTAFNITKILDQHPDYAVFNQLLTKTHVAQEINKRKSITVLVVPNGAISGIAGQDEETIKIIMKIHVVLDYYDSAKIKKINDDTTLTTLYQTTGSADKEEGFLKVEKDNNDIKLMSAHAGSSVSARVTKVVTSIPSDISVVEVTNAIIPPGLTGSPISPSPSSTSKKHKSPSPSPHKSPSPSPSDDADDSKSAPSDDDAPAPSPKKHGHEHEHKHKHKHTPAPAPSDDDSSDGASDDADADPDADDADANADDDSSADSGDDRMSDEDDSSSPRNVVVSGFVLVASLFTML